MSRFVRASKYRHVFAQPGKKEYSLENVKVTNSAWDTNIVSASALYLSINWNASGGGAFAILPLPSPFSPMCVAGKPFPYKIPDNIPLARGHTAPVLDTDWSPHDDSLVASGGDDGKVMLWSVPVGTFDEWADDTFDVSVLPDFDPTARLDVSARKVGQVLWHPTAANVLATASGEHVVKLWDVAAPEDARVVLRGHTDAVQSMAFSPNGSLLATTCKDRKVRVFDPRVGGDAVCTAEGHGGMKGARVVWMGDDRLATTGFSRMSERQVGVWDVGSELTNVKMVGLDQSSGVIMPFWSDNGILFLAGKGDGNIRFLEHTPTSSDPLYPLSEHKSTDPQRGMCFLPRRALAVSECEIARAYKVSGSTVEPLAFIVPRKSESFQGDIFPPALAGEAACSATEFFAGKGSLGKKVVDLETGKISIEGSASGLKAQTQTAPPQAVKPPPAIAVSKSHGPPSPAVAPAITHTLSAPTPSPAPIPTSTTITPTIPTPAVNTSKLEDENSSLKSDLREAREKIRSLEIQVEAMRANARRAAEMMLGS